MVATDRQDAALFNGSIDIQNVIGRPAANIDDQCAKIFLVLRDHNLGGGERAKDHVFNIEGQFFDAADGVLDAIAHPMYNVKIGL